MNGRETAKDLLKHYLSHAKPDGFYNGDSYREMEAIVDEIIDQAVAEAIAAITKVQQAQFSTEGSAS